MPNIFLGALEMYVLVRKRKSSLLTIDECRQSEAIGTLQASREGSRVEKLMLETPESVFVF